MNPEEIVQAFDNGERKLEPLLEKMGWKSWLGVAELGLVMDSQIVDFIRERLSPAELKVLELVEMRLSGEINLDSIEEALVVARDPETRDLSLEGRLRMERGLVYFEKGDIENARPYFERCADARAFGWTSGFSNIQSKEILKSL